MTITKSTNEAIEISIIQQLKRAGSFRGCAVVSKGDSEEAPESLPCVMVNCASVTRYADTPDAMNAKEAAITCTLYGDSEQMTQKAFEKYAVNLENKLFSLTGMQTAFNAPSSGRDTRKSRQVYLHYISDQQTESAEFGTVWQFTASCTFVCQA